jgi:hypothetical protein
MACSVPCGHNATQICHLFWAFARMDHVPNSTLPQQMMTMLAKDDFAMLKSEVGR